ncbi:MAG: glycosyl hydrolase 115 family protein [Prevotella sp.]|nr:glycosyl hydrolase 115 family protein [Prevotella sp.]
MTRNLSFLRNLTVLFILLMATEAMAASRFVSFSGGDLLLNRQGDVTIGIAADDCKGVLRAARSLALDLGKVTGHDGNVIEGAPESADATIVVGTLGHSSLIDALVAKRQIDAGQLRGKHEKFLITVVGQQLVIAGSDRRGTIYGIYELSRQIGVSPWYYWADVPVEHHDNIYIQKGTYTDGEPAIEYRGLFLNDEAPCLTSWVQNTFHTNYGGHEFYEKVFELLLRLRGNMLWPAMWSWAFYADDPENSRLADEMGIVIGTSHHEPMARNHQEWARSRSSRGAWNYRTNQQELDRFFREGIERMRGTEDIVTIGMRGDGDEAMSEEADTRLLERIVKNQRRIISDVTGKPAKKTPQVWALYKEVLDYYDKGMRVPDDVMMLLCDDNWGNLRRVPTAKERQHKGGWGLYYHVDYVGAPRNSKWLNVTPSQNMWEQLTLAYDYGISRMWILNVGDLKPMEYPIQLFMDMAWNPKAITTDVVASHTEPFCNATFGPEEGPEVARLLNLCCKYNGRVTAEMLNAQTYDLASGEWERVVADYVQLEAEALRQYIRLQPQQLDTYRQLVLFPIQAMGNVYSMYYAQAMNLQLASEGNPDCNQWADRVAECFKRDSLLCSEYNNDIANGKWRGMMTQKHIGYKSWNDDFGPTDVMPAVKRIGGSKANGENSQNTTASKYSERMQGGHFFTEKDGIVAMEAEHFFAKRDSADLCWTLIPDMGRTLSAVSVQPYIKSILSQGGPSLTYRFQSENAVRKVVVVVKSTLDFLNKGGLCFRVRIDGGEPFVANFNKNLNEQPENIYSIYYPTVASRVVAVDIALQAPAGTHELTLEPLDPAIVFEKVVVDCGGGVKGYLFGKESPRQVQIKE